MEQGIKMFVPQQSKERRRSEVFIPQPSMICYCYTGGT